MRSLLDSIAAYDELDSTSNYVAKALEEGRYVEGTVILAHFQTGGRGQRGRTWQSNRAENLTFSFALSTAFLPSPRRFILAKAISLALADYLEALGIPEVRIKWPNDILAGNAKIAGILIENTAGPMPYSIIGIGLNLNQKKFDLSYAASSAALEKGTTFNTMHELKRLLGFLDSRLRMLYDDEDARLHADYMNSLYGKGRWVKVAEGPRIFQAMITDVDHSGLISLRSRNGNLGQYQAREVSITF